MDEGKNDFPISCSINSCSRIIKVSHQINSPQNNICPVTGLPFLRKPEWTGLSFGKDYKTTLTVIGGCIFMSQPSGYVTKHDVENFFKSCSKIIFENIGDRPYIQIEDYSNLKGNSLEARRAYINHMRNRDRLIGVIYYGLSPLLKMNITLAKRVRIVKLDVQIVNNYSEAVKLALQMLSNRKTEPDNLISIPPTQNYIPSVKNEKVCHITGLHITTKPEWTDIDLGEGYSVTFKFIGDRILHSSSRGKAIEKAMENLFKEKAKVLKSKLEPNEKFFELRDYSNIDLKITRASRSQMAKGLLVDKDRILGFIGYNAPLSVKLAINVGKRLFRSPFPMYTVKDYKRAIKEAVKATKHYESAPGRHKNTISIKDNRALTNKEIERPFPNSKQLSQYVEELLSFIGSINWETDGIDQNYIEKNPSHPLNPLFDTISLIKMDIDDLLQERKNIELELESEKAYLENLFENASEAIAWTDNSHKLIRVNKEFTRLFGYTNDEVIGHSIDELVAPDHLIDEAYSASNHFTKKSTAIHFDSVRKHKNGKLINVSILASPTVINKKVVGFYGIYRDITERKQAEKEIHMAKEEWERTFHAIDEMILILDLQMRIIRLNHAAAQAIKIETENPIMRYCYEVYGKLTEPCPNCPGIKTIQNKTSHTAVVAFRKLGKIFQITTAPIFDDHGQFTSIVHSATDITKRKELEAHLQQAQKMEAIGTLAGGIAHDFNNILSVIYGYIELARYHIKPNPEANNNLDHIQIAADRAKELVKQILTFSRQTKGERKPIKISLIVNEALKLLRSSLPTTIDIKQNLKARKDVVVADPTQIHQVLMNLCTNASHAMMENGGKLTVDLKEVYLDSKEASVYNSLEPGNYLELTVSDTGHGIEPTIIKRIFEPFFTTKKPGEGTGMGLAVIHGIVKSHNGDIKVDSLPGKGTTFRLLLPLVDEVTEEQIFKKLVLPGGRNEHILVVDDEKMLVDMEAQILEKLGYKVTARCSSMEALEAFRAQPDRFDLLLTDFTMPQMTGTQLIKEIRQIRPQIPVILCTGFSTSFTPEQIETLNIQAFLNKPLDKNTLATAIRDSMKIQNKSGKKS